MGGGDAWEPLVSSFCAESRGEVLVIDALTPRDEAVWERLDARPPIVAADLVEVLPDDVLPGGALAIDDGRPRHETPLYLPEQRALVFADGLTAPGGVLRVWHTRWHESRVLPALRALLELPFELVLVSHGEPVHDREEFERALERRPWDAD